MGRLAWQFGLAFALAMAVAGGIAFLVARHQLLTDQDEALTHERSKLILPGQPNDSHAIAARISARLARKALSSRTNMLYAPDGRLLAGRLEMAEPGDGFSAILYRDGSPKWHRGRALSLRLADGARLVIVEHTAIDENLREMALTGLVVLMVVGGLAGVGAAWALTTQIARRLEHTVATADAITRGDLSRRVPLAGLDGIFAHQADNLNHMLDRMAQMAGSQRQFASHLAHDLRTPLTRLQDLLQDTADEAQMEKARRECGSIIAIFEALLRLSEIEAGRRPTAMSPLALDEMIADVAETMEPVIADAGSHLACSHAAPTTVLADAGLVQQLLVNLLDNVALHTPAGTQASMALTRGEHEAVITIADNGPGIAPDQHARVIHPFERGETRTSGSGLGLAIAQAIMRFHNGTLELIDNRPGLAVCLRFPMSA